MHILRALAPFAIFVVAGAWIVWAGSPGQRLFVFLGAVLAMAGYVGSLSLSMPMVIETEIGCAKDSAR
ncbi:MAG: hypothetical protein EOP59_19175 [Sphingomonadales bacterium]|nr:MAG: hypothetical protein EOP59_19175 [Sphingomonadales bacterium]